MGRVGRVGDDFSSRSLCRCNCWNITIITCQLIGVFFLSASYSTIGPFFPKEAEKKDVSPAMVGVIIGSTTLFGAILSPFGGYIIPRIGFVIPTFLGLLLTVIIYVSLGFVNLISSQWGFILVSLLLRITDGVASALFFTASFALVPILFPKHIGAVQGCFELACGLGFGFGYLTGGFLYKLGGFKLPFLFIAGCTAVMTIPCTLLVNRVKMKESEKMSLPPRIVISISTDLVVIALCLSIFFSATSVTFYNPILEPFLRNQFNFDSVKTTLMFLIQPISYTASCFIVGLLVDKMGFRRYTSISGLFLGAVSLITMGVLYHIGIMSPFIIGTVFLFLGSASAMGMIPVFGDLLEMSE